MSWPGPAMPGAALTSRSQPGRPVELERRDIMFERSVVPTCSHTKSSSQPCRKRKRCPFESYNESETVGVLTNLISRGQLSIASAAEIARSVVKDHDLPDAAAIR